MSEALSSQAAEFSTVIQARRNPVRSRDLELDRVARVTRPRVQRPVKVPMLDWAGDLFSDNASMAELLLEDFSPQWNLPALSRDRSCPAMYAQAAA